jgi:hypothetical protein
MAMGNVNKYGLLRGFGWMGLGLVNAVFIEFGINWDFKLI